MNLFHPKWKAYSIISFSIMFISCGGDDIQEEIVKNYESGNLKISAQYFSAGNVIEKKFYSEGGEIIHFERDSLQYSSLFKEYLRGNWIMEKMIVNEKTVFEIERYSTTVLLTSIKGYTNLFIKDTLKAFNVLKIQKSIILPIIQDYNGINLINIMNDKLILSFEDPQTSVECAMAIQAAVKSEKKLNYKMGKHYGNILKKENEIFGYDINIAEGMRFISAVGGIVISNNIYESIKENEEIETMPLDPRTFKTYVGLDTAVKPYAIISNGLPEPANFPEEIFLSVYKQSAMDLRIPPNLYKFSTKKLKISGQQFNADYKIFYLDSSQVELEGKWTYGKVEDKNYRTKRLYYKYSFQPISYNSFLWKGFLKDPEKEEEVLFRRLLLPEIINESDTTFVENPSS